MKQIPSKLFLMAALAIPLNSADNWQVLQFSGLKPNKVYFTDKGLKVSVDKSASPIIYPFKKAIYIESIHLKGELSQLINFKPQQIQGQKSLDDYTLRLGLVIEGTKKLSFAQKLIAPAWVKKLYSLAPKGTGVDHIKFINATEQPKLLNTHRTHPLTKLFKESNPWLIDKSGVFDLKYTLPKAQKVIALWISIDGDDTKSSFEVKINEINFNIKKP